jgi:hypothetical protein
VATVEEKSAKFFADCLTFLRKISHKVHLLKVREGQLIQGSREDMK